MNLEQVARRAKVSTATVSRVLNNASVVKTSTRARVVKAIEELKYHPNLHARNLAGGKSKTLLGNGSTGHIVLQAAANAEPIENVPICVLAHVSINFVVKISYASQPIGLSIRK